MDADLFSRLDIMAMKHELLLQQPGYSVTIFFQHFQVYCPEQKRKKLRHTTRVNQYVTYKYRTGTVFKTAFNRSPGLLLILQ